MEQKRKYKEYARLDRDRILDAGLAIASRPGTTVVRVRDLGEELGADPSAIYRHFENKGELLRALMDRLMKKVTERFTVPPQEWREFITQGCENLFTVFLDYPSIAAEAAKPASLGPAGTGLASAALTALSSAGLRDEDLVRHYAALTGFVIAFVSLSAREQLGVQERIADSPWVELHEDGAPDAADPQLARLLKDVGGLRYGTTYRDGIQVMLDAVAAAGKSA